MLNLNTLLGIALISLTMPMAFAQRIDTSKVLFGVEYTFQDQEMVNEPGRSTMTTPHKEAKTLELAYSLVELLKLDPSAIEQKTTWKPGLYINVPKDGQWVVNAEPVTIEVNTTPRHLHEIASTAKPIYEAAQANGLVPYVNTAAERSGMGHIHVGAAKMAENPFYLNPLLLRNVMVYFHKHPSLLHGFGEAFDVGFRSNIETYHERERQLEFFSAVDMFDRWYDRSSAEERSSQGMNRYLEALALTSHFAEFYEHYRYINLEHLKRHDFTPEDSGKLTVEFRAFRPPKNPQTAEAFATLLVAVMELQSKPDHKEPLEWISQAEYERFNTGSKVVDDWAKVRKELRLNNRYLDLAIAEYKVAIQRFRYPIKSLPHAEIFMAYSEKELKGTRFELRLPLEKYPQRPHLRVGPQYLDFEKVRIGTQDYWMTVVDSAQFQLDPRVIMSGDLKVQRVSAPKMCRKVFE